MPIINAGPNRLRFIFNDGVTSVDLGPDPTYGEVAQSLRDLRVQDHGGPVSIDLTLCPYPISACGSASLLHRADLV
jgi:hypothetical protein